MPNSVRSKKRNSWKPNEKWVSGNSLNSKQASRVFGRRSQSYRVQRFDGPQSQMPNSVRSKKRNSWKPNEKWVSGNSLNSKQASRVFGRRSQSYRVQRFDGPQSQMPNSVRSKKRNSWKPNEKWVSGNSLNSKQASRVFGRRSQSYRVQRFDGPQSQMPNSVRSKKRNSWKPNEKMTPGINADIR